MHIPSTPSLTLALLLAYSVTPICKAIAQTDATPMAALGQTFDRSILPLSKTYCLQCHSAAKKKGKLDLEQFKSLADVRRAPLVWRKVAEQLETGEMPPDDHKQPTAKQRAAMIDWAKRYLHAEALANAGDPGEVVLRRLSNAELTYTLRDLTGVDLDPARDLPIDGAAGEGFTNAGEALVMSPVLLNKYLQAAKRVADHAVLLPDGIRFSHGESRRDWTDELLNDIRLFYARHTSGAASAAALDRWSGVDPKQLSSNDGRVDLTPYFVALVRHRDRLTKDLKQVDAVARQEQVNTNYLRHLATMLVSGEPSSPLLNRLRARWRAASPNDVPALVAVVRNWQKQLWSFNAVGQFGLVRPWQAARNPMADSVTLRHKLTPSADGRDAVLYLIAGNAGDGNADDVVVWHQPRIEMKGRPAILLRDVGALAHRIERTSQAELRKTTQYLAAVAAARAQKQPVESLARQHRLDADVLRAWMNYLDLGRQVNRRVTGHFTNKMSKVHGYETVNGWGIGQTPNMLANKSRQPVSFLTLTVPARGVTLHPSPSKRAAVAWQSPIDGRITLYGKVADADRVCGNGFAWSVRLLTAAGSRVLAKGVVDNGRAADFKPKGVFDVRKGDVLSVVIAARDRNHVCDTTQVALTIQEQDAPKRVWGLANDVVDSIHAGNPHADSYKHAGVWHFYSIADTPKQPVNTIPTGSSLARWRQSVVDRASDDVVSRLAETVHRSLTGKSPSAPDRAMTAQVKAWDGPMDWLGRAQRAGSQDDDTPSDSQSVIGIDPARFGRHPTGGRIDAASLAARAPQVVEVRLPAALLRGGEFVVRGELDGTAGKDGSVQFRLGTSRPKETGDLLANTPIVTRPNGAARQRVTAGFDDFRALFPQAMCYARIVPVDEVVTLLMFHREDEPLRRLMLDAQQDAELDRLWLELHFVSEDAFRLITGLEQLHEFATQDARHLIPRLKALQKPINDRAAALRQAQADAEPAHLRAVLAFADRAWRRPLSDAEKRSLTDLYRSQRDRGQSHDAAIRTTLARVLVSPSFLYKVEQPAPGTAARPVTSNELATRLSYFLWSSLPDVDLRRIADAGRLTDQGTLAEQTQRMLGDERVRAMAGEFAAQWLGVRDFDEHDEKNESLYPTFADLRGPMRDEVVRFFEDLIRRNGSVLDIFQADHTFLNEALAKHYNVPGVIGPQWRRADGMRKLGRGGVLGMGAVVSKHSGASRTSPVLRGTWVVETVLGEHLPKPPPNVPDLPESENDSTLTVRQLTERHRQVKQCAVCHDRIDPFGFALESFDTIGRRRDKDAAGRPIDTKVALKSGESFEGIDGLRRYLVDTKRDQVVRQFCRKMLGYALGRGVQVSDDPLLDEMVSGLKQNDYRIHTAILAIVRSKQFRYQRGQDAAEEHRP